MHSCLHASADEFFERLPSVLLSKTPSGQPPVRILMVGDVVGKPGRKVLKTVLQRLRTRAQLDFVTVNGENAAGGFGITQKIFAEFVDNGVDAVTMGNHWNDKPDVHPIRASDPRLVLPQNLPDVSGVERIPEFQIPGRNKSISIVNLMGNFAMKHQYNDPFVFVERELPVLAAKVASGNTIVLVDMHAEASSEKQALAWFMDGVVAGMIGTHTHTPTSDERVTRKGTAFLTDVGMTGPYYSVIGMDINRSMKRYFGAKEKKAQEVGDDDLWFCGFLIEVDPHTGQTEQAHRLQFRDTLNTWTVSSVMRPR